MMDDETRMKHIPPKKRRRSAAPESYAQYQRKLRKIMRFCAEVAEEMERRRLEEDMEWLRICTKNLGYKPNVKPERS